MGNCLSQCIAPQNREIRLNSSISRQNAFFTRQSDILAQNNPISTAIHMMSTPSEEESIGMAIILSNNVNAVANLDQTENGLKFLLEYLQLSLPIDCPLSGSITSLILREATLPSRSFLKEVSEILKLKSLITMLNEIISIPSKSWIQNSTHNVSGKIKKSSCVSTTKCEPDLDVNQQFLSIQSDVKDNGSQQRDKVGINQTLLKAHNACLIIDCLATRLCGPNTDYLLNNDIIEFLIVCCNVSKIDIEGKLGYQIWTIVLRAILCFEKFALTRNCKNKICEYFEMYNINIPFEHLETFSDSKDMLKREVGFVSQWLLDNAYTNPNRLYTYLNLDRSNLNAIMNMKDASQYIKLSPIGLEVRCDSDSFESVRCTFEVVNGIYYYEAQLVTAGIMQIGWATRNSYYMNHDGRGVGDDMFSLAYDGCRKVIWYNGVPHKERLLPKWKPGDILGCLINVNKKFVLFSLNGKYTKKQATIFSQSCTGFYAGASFLNNQQCLFNFGREPFKYPPNNFFNSFNEQGSLDDKSKIILPRVIHLAELNQSMEHIEDPCNICFNVAAEVCLEPCCHKGFCKTCISKVENCPLCRSPIKAIRSDPLYYPTNDLELINSKSS